MSAVNTSAVNPSVVVFAVVVMIRSFFFGVNSSGDLPNLNTKE